MKHYWKKNHYIDLQEVVIFQKTKTVQLKVCLREKTFDNIYNMENFKRAYAWRLNLKFYLTLLLTYIQLMSFYNQILIFFPSTFFWHFNFCDRPKLNFDCFSLLIVCSLLRSFWLLVTLLIRSFLTFCQTWSDSMWLHKWYVLHNKKAIILLSRFYKQMEQFKKKPNWFNYIPMLVISRKNVPSNVLMSSCSSGEFIDTLNQWGH